MPGQTVLEKPVRIYRLQTEKSAFYCYISLGEKNWHIGSSENTHKKSR